MFIRLVRNHSRRRTTTVSAIAASTSTSTCYSSHYRQSGQYGDQGGGGLHPERRRQASTTTSTSSSSSNSTQQTFHTKNGRVKIDLSKPQLVGVHQSRGERPYQEDRHAVRAVMLDRGEVDRAIQTLGMGGSGNPKSTSGPAKPSSPASAGDAPAESASPSPTAQEQALYVAVFDGHNGHSVSHFLSEHLHSRIVEYPRSQVNETVTTYRGLGGYLRRYRAGILQDLVEQPAPAARSRAVPVERRRTTAKSSQKETPAAAADDDKTAAEKAKKEKAKVEAPKPWNLHQRIHASFLDADLEIIENDKESGSVATIALLHSLDEPRNPYFSSEKLHLVIAHLGDTRALLCTAPEGEAVILTEKHHPEARSETDRLMRTRTGAVTDSFGESRWAGTLANTRGFGDAHYKQLGVFAEPAISSRLLSPASEYAFLILLSDGITDMLSDQEICDLVRGYKDPTRAARNVVSFAESIGAQDNLTCVVVPLPGWTAITSEDSTKKRREFRVQNFEGRSNRQNRM